MEASGGTTKNKKKRRRRDKKPPPLEFGRTAFPILLAASANARRPHAHRLLRRLLRAHLALPPSPGLLALLPLLLASRSPSVRSLAAEAVGAAALCSLEANETVACDGAVVKGLLRALGSQSERAVMAACNAVLDLSSSPVGRERLRDLAAIEKLLLLFCQVATVSSNSVFFQDMGKQNNVCFNTTKDNLLQLVLDAVVILVNTSNEHILAKIPDQLVRKFIPLLRELWHKARGSASDGSQGKCCSRSTKYDLATTLFRLTMNHAHHAGYLPQEVRANIFGNRESEFENFVLSYWEDEPLLIQRASKNLDNENIIFSSLFNSFSMKEAGTALDSMLQGMVSCPPIASDELDITCFLKEVHDLLGSPIMYAQDIRVLRTEMVPDGSAGEIVKKEVHFFKDNMISELTSIDFVQKCKEAFKDGYTVALRGMEFRSHEVAAIAEGLAELFGQPSIGANVYLTPPRSQGLAGHYDDHCVFVWQLFGHKQWRILPRPKSFLPRLYESPCSLPGLEGNACGGMQFLLSKGDVLYIPRGYSHEAQTNSSKHDCQNDISMGYSLHLTLGIEVEPPFEWEGFAHVALHCWNEKQKEECDFTGSNPGRLQLMFVNLLHVAIRMLSDRDCTFRKACMVAALPFKPVTEEGHDRDALTLNQRATFTYIINRIDASSVFLEVFKSIESAIDKGNDDTLQWMRWLQHLPQEGEKHEKIDYGNPLGVFGDIVDLYRENIEEASTRFMEVKSRFCHYNIYIDACKSFKMLLEKYKKTRKQYMNGMLSLHSI